MAAGPPVSVRSCGHAVMRRIAVRSVDGGATRKHSLNRLVRGTGDDLGDPDFAAMVVGGDLAIRIVLFKIFLADLARIELTQAMACHNETRET